ncbi:MAG: S9 family peptidase [Planctomycetes bacterium]|nr:S9 family peptidase [Planctomycetota bacterium]
MQRFSFEQFLSIPECHSPSMSPLGKWVVYLSDVTGSDQIWRAPVSGGPLWQLTDFEDRVMEVHWSPTGDYLLFGKDTGGNERLQMYLMHPDGKHTIPIDEDPGVIHVIGGFSHDGKRVSFASNRRSSQHFDICVFDIATGVITTICETDGVYKPEIWSPDCEHMIVSKRRSNLDDDFFILDVKTGMMSCITHHENEEIIFQSPRMVPGENAVYVLTNWDTEFIGLVRIDLETLERTPVYTPSWDVEHFVISRDGRWMALVVNEDGCSKLMIQRRRTKGWKIPPAIPVGEITKLTFSFNGMHLAFCLTSATEPSAIYSYSLDIHRLYRLTPLDTSGIPPETFVEPEIIRFESFDGREIPAFFYLPHGAKPQDRFPVIIDVHGGPEGQRRTNFAPTFQYYLSCGFAVFSPNNRGSTGYGKEYYRLDDKDRRAESIRDVQYGAMWLKKCGFIDQAKIVLTGTSYGGFVVLSAITNYPDLFVAAVDVVGIANFRTFLENTTTWRRRIREGEYGSVEEFGDFLDSISPIHKAHNINCPLLVIHGRNDPRVPLIEAEQIATRVRDIGGIVELLVFDDEGHSLTKRTNRIAAQAKIMEFLNNFVLDKDVFGK